MVKSSDEMFNRSVKVFEAEESFRFMIIEVDSQDDLFEHHKNCLLQTLQSPSKRLIVITDENSEIKFENHNHLKIEVPHIYPKVLTQHSLDQVLNRPVTLQNYPTTWKAIAQEDFIKNHILLKDLLQTSEIAQNLEVSDEKFYVERTFVYKPWIKPRFLRECKDNFFYNQQEFETKLITHPKKTFIWWRKLMWA
jgi:hypothetical protein